MRKVWFGLFGTAAVAAMLTIGLTAANAARDGGNDGDTKKLPTPQHGVLAEFAESGLLNIVGGCCGTTPDHIRAIKAKVADLAPRPIPTIDVAMRLSGLEAFSVSP